MTAPTAVTRAPLVTRARNAISDLWGARELTANLVRRDLKVRHRGTFLGMLWSLTTPLLLVGLYWFIFKFILSASPVQGDVRPDEQPVPFAVYFFAGLVVWNLFNSSLQAASGSVVGSGYLLRKVYFPRAILPLSAVLSSLVTFAFEFSVLFVAVRVGVGGPSIHLLWVPVIVAALLLMTYGLSLLLSALTVFLRDVAHFIGVFMQLWFWGTPIIYSLQFVSNRPGFVRMLELNPMTGIVVSFRNVVVLNQPPRFDLLAYGVGFGVVALFVGAVVFNHWQRMFSEIV